MQRILIYGDSNTWGYIPGSLDFKTFTYERYPADIRWTGILQKRLGNNCHIIDEGLPGRTIATTDPGMPWVNGMDYFYPCFLSHSPLDLVVIMLGTNDLKHAYNLTPQQIKDHLRKMCGLISNNSAGPSNVKPAILIVAPLLVHTEKLSDNMHPFYAGKDAYSKELVHCFAELAEEENYSFCDASKIELANTSDGLHLDLTSHLALANLLELHILSALKKGDIHDYTT